MTHTSDTGGSLRGVSTEIFHEGIRFPGIKLVERDELRSDIYRSITEQCRDPDYVGLDLKARIASNNVCDRGYLGLIEKYGVDFIEEASHKLMDDTEKLARKKLRSLPDGTWRARMYASTTIKGEGGKEEVKPYKLVCAMNKEGDEITFDVTGTSPQNADYNNATFFATWSLLFTVVAGHLFWDLPWNAGIIQPLSSSSRLRDRC
jgi:N-methylhydantoinase B